MNERQRTIDAATTLLSRKLADEGKLIEAGWIIFRSIVQPADEFSDRELRHAFMAGAQHLFASMVGIMDPGSEPTDDDMRRMDLINKEMEDFVEELELRHGPAKGHA